MSDLLQGMRKQLHNRLRWNEATKLKIPLLGFNVTYWVGLPRRGWAHVFQLGLISFWKKVVPHGHLFFFPFFYPLDLSKKLPNYRTKCMPPMRLKPICRRKRRAESHSYFPCIIWRTGCFSQPRLRFAKWSACLWVSNNCEVRDRLMFRCSDPWPYEAWHWVHDGLQ